MSLCGKMRWVRFSFLMLDGALDPGTRHTSAAGSDDSDSLDESSARDLFLQTPIAPLSSRRAARLSAQTRNVVEQIAPGEGEMRKNFLNGAHGALRAWASRCAIRSLRALDPGVHTRSSPNRAQPRRT